MTTLFSGITGIVLLIAIIVYFGGLFKRTANRLEEVIDNVGLSAVHASATLEAHASAYKTTTLRSLANDIPNSNDMSNEDIVEYLRNGGKLNK